MVRTLSFLVPLPLESPITLRPFINRRASHVFSTAHTSSTHLSLYVADMGHIPAAISSLFLPHQSFITDSLSSDAHIMWPV
jgi:hypothetical protein